MASVIPLIRTAYATSAAARVRIARMGVAFSKGQRPELDAEERMFLRTAQYERAVHAGDGSDDECAMLSVQVREVSYKPTSGEHNNGDGAPMHERPGEIVSTLTLPEPGSYLELQFNQFTLYVESDGQMALHNTGRPALANGVPPRGSEGASPASDDDNV